MRVADCQLLVERNRVRFSLATCDSPFINLVIHWRPVIRVVVRRPLGDGRLVCISPCPAHPPWRPVMPQETGPGPLTRRDFSRNALQSLTTLVLIEGLWSRRLLGADVRPIVADWFKEINAISRDVHEHRSKDVEFQQSLE